MTDQEECPTNFYVGQKVVFVNGGAGWHTFDGENSRDDFIRLVHGEVYTIREIIEHPSVIMAFRLVEIRNKPENVGGVMLEPLYWYRDFRPAVERKTDISIFQTILDDINTGKVVELV